MNNQNQYYNTISILNLDLIEVEKTFEYKGSALKVLVLQQPPHVGRGRQAGLSEVQMNALNLYNEEQKVLAIAAFDQEVEQKNAEQQQIAQSLEAELQHRNELEGKLQRMVALNESLNSQVQQIPELQEKLAEAEQKRKEVEANLAELSAKIEVLQLLVDSFEADKAQREEASVAENARIQNRIDGFGKYVGFSLVGIIMLLLFVAVYMNLHNLQMLYANAIPTPILAIFAVGLSFMPLIYAWLKDQYEIKAATYMIPLDFLITILLYMVFNENSHVYKNSVWLQTNLTTVHTVLSLGMGIFYSAQVYFLVNKALAVLASKTKTYEDFFRAMFR